MVRCWDLEANKIIRHYHGHLSGVYALSLHPTLDILVTAGRDASARVWDMRTKAQIHVLSGHTATVADVKCQESDPQVITGSMDSTVRYASLAPSSPASDSPLLPQVMGPSSRQNARNADAPQKVRPRARDPPNRVLFRLRLRGGQQHQKVEVPRGRVRIQFQRA
jgi:WD40 repeat protein